MDQDSVFERIARGEGSAIRECMDRYGGLVWSLARRFSETAADAEDASQEIFLELWKSAHRYDASVGSEAVFVATIARRRLIDRLRSSSRRPRTESFDEGHMDVAQEPEDAGSVAADVAAAERALAQLDPGQRQVLLMGIVEGMTHAEIAAATGKPLGTVKTQPPPPRPQRPLAVEPTPFPSWRFIPAPRTPDATLWPAGEHAAEHRLREFIEQRIGHYGRPERPALRRGRVWPR